MKNISKISILSFLIISMLMLQSCEDRFERILPEGLVITGVRVDFLNFFTEDNEKWDVEDDSGPDVMFVYGEFDSNTNILSGGGFLGPQEINSNSELPYSFRLPSGEIIITNTEWLFALYDGDGDVSTLSTNQLITFEAVNAFNNTSGRFEVDPDTGVGEQQITNARGDAFTIFYRKL